MKFSNDDASYYKPTKKEDESWPPRFMKFVLKLEGGEDEDREVAFVDARRLARIRLVDCAGDQMRKTSPLKENGPDPVIDKDILTREWLQTKLRSKKVPVKALLLDQANISGVGNWVAYVYISDAHNTPMLTACRDEVLYQAKIHPEQYSNTFSDAQINTLHDSLVNVCTTACETLADSSQFPENWLMKHRWDKGKKGANVLPNGEKIIHLKVGGRTSAVVPSVQKKTGPVAGDVGSQDLEDEEADDDEGEKKPKVKAKARAKASKAKGTNGVKVEDEAESEEEVEPASKKRKAPATNSTQEEQKTPKKAKAVKEEPTPESGKRRSSRRTK
jgi:hypothetical protein